MEIIEERTIGPSLGAENITKGFHSVPGASSAICVFMAVYYMLFGVFSGVALAVNLLLLVAVLSMLQATLTLPGMAAMALALGMAIDSNVLINERVREELRSGASPQAAIHAGYDRAWGTILDSNVTTLIAGVALLAFGSGPVRGFAVVHCIGILDLDVLGGVLLARPGQPLVRPQEEAQDRIDRHGLEATAVDHGRWPTRNKGHAKWNFSESSSDIPFMRHALVFNVDLVPHLRRWRCSSWSHRGLHLSVEFTGGTVMEVGYPQSADVEKVRETIGKLGFADVQVQNFGTSRDVHDPPAGRKRA